MANGASGNVTAPYNVQDDPAYKEWLKTNPPKRRPIRLSDSPTRQSGGQDMPWWLQALGGSGLFGGLAATVPPWYR